MGTTMTNQSGDEVHLKESAVAVKDAVVDLAGEARRFARQQVGHAKESAGEMMDNVKSRAETCNQNVVSFIRQNPYTSLAIAAGIGMAAGIMLRRR